MAGRASAGLKVDFSFDASKWGKFKSMMFWIFYASLSSLEERRRGIQLFVNTRTRGEFDGLENAVQNIKGMKPLTDSKLVHLMRSTFVLELYYHDLYAGNRAGEELAKIFPAVKFESAKQRSMLISNIVKNIMRTSTRFGL